MDEAAPLKERRDDSRCASCGARAMSQQNAQAEVLNVSQQVFRVHAVLEGSGSKRGRSDSPRFLLHLKAWFNHVC